MATTDKCNDRLALGATNLVEVIYTNKIYVYTDILMVTENRNKIIA